MPLPPKKIDRCAAAAGQNHPARRCRKNDVGAGLYAYAGGRAAAQSLWMQVVGGGLSGLAPQFQ